MSGMNRERRQKADIEERWNRWIKANEGFAELKRLVVHPEDWFDMGMPLEFGGLTIKPLGVRPVQAWFMREAV